MARYAPLLAFALVVGTAPVVASQGDAVDRLLDRLGDAPGLEARFREEKRIALLTAPLVNEGTLHFARPERRVRHTERPARSTLLLDGERLVMGDARARRTLDLSDHPVVRAVVAPFVALLSGDRRALSRSWRAEVEDGEEGAWTIRLAPSRPEVARVLRRIVVRGRAGTIERLTVTERSGDVSDTTFTEVRARRYSRGELQRIFVVPGR